MMTSTPRGARRGAPARRVHGSSRGRRLRFRRGRIGALGDHGSAATHGREGLPSRRVRIHLPGPPPRGPPRGPRPRVPRRAGAGRIPAWPRACGPIAPTPPPWTRSPARGSSSRPRGPLVALRRPALRDRGGVAPPGRVRAARGRPLPLPAGLPRAPRRARQAAEDLAAIDVAGRGARPRARSSAASIPSCPGTPTPSSRPPSMVGSLLDLEADFIAALRQKKIPEVAARLSRARARARAGLPPRPLADRASPRAAEATTRRSSPSSRRLLERYAFWCRLRLRASRRSARRDPRAGPRSASPRRSTTRTSSRPSAPTPPCRRSASAPRERHRRREGFGLTDPRMTRARGPGRDALLPALPRAREGLLLEGLLRRQDRRPGRRTRSASR